MPLIRSRYLLTALLLCLSLAGFGQWTPDSPYHLSPVRELIIGGGGVGSRLLGHHLRIRTPEIRLIDLRLGTVPFYDRLTKPRKAQWASAASDVTVDVSLLLPAVLLAGQRSRHDFGKVAVLFSETMLLNQGMTDLIKGTFHRPRPYLYDTALNPQLLVTDKDRVAFVSGHTSTAAASCFFLGRVFADYYPESPLRTFVWAAAATFPVATAYLRIRAGQHYPSDVVAGYLLGALIGYGVPALHRNPARPRRLELTAGHGGLRLTYALR